MLYGDAQTIRGLRGIAISPADPSPPDLSGVVLVDPQEETAQEIQITTDTPRNTISVAACHKTLFGAVQLDRVVYWAHYHHQLGMDHIYIWYLPEIADYPHFDELKSLPYVTLIPNESQVQVKEVYKGYHRVVGDLDQRETERLCLTEVAKDYDWVFFGDADEFVWMSEQRSIQEFLGDYDNLTYLSLGKHSYDLQHRVSSHGDYFGGLSQFPFTLGSLCFVKPEESEFVQLLRGQNCPRHPGKAKLLVRPSHHSWLNVHGDRWPNPQEGSMHLDSTVAHIKEWPRLFSNHEAVETPPVSLDIQRPSETSIRALHMAYSRNENGSYTLRYDDDLEKWMEFVAGRQV